MYTSLSIGWTYENALSYNRTVGNALPKRGSNQSGSFPSLVNEKFCIMKKSFGPKTLTFTVPKQEIISSSLVCGLKSFWVSRSPGLNN